MEVLYQRYFLRMNQNNMTSLLTLLIGDNDDDDEHEHEVEDDNVNDDDNDDDDDDDDDDADDDDKKGPAVLQPANPQRSPPHCDSPTTCREKSVLSISCVEDFPGLPFFVV